jgi:hypothetical protein
MAKMSLETFVAQLRSTFEGELIAVVLYGSAAGNEPGDERAGNDVLILVEELDLARLEGAAAMMRDWTGAGNPPPFILTVEEWRRSTDVFPMEYADILERHRVLYGEPPFEATAIDPSHLRHELEHEAMGALMHLRKGVLAAAGDNQSRLELLAVSKGTVLAIFRALLRLHGERPPSDPLLVCDRAAHLAAFDADAFHRVVKHVRKTEKIPPRESAPLLAAYVEGVERLVKHLDEYVHSTREEQP